jgi:hypothetical protein
MNEVWHARSALSRVVESGSGDQDLAAGTWQRLEALSGIRPASARTTSSVRPGQLPAPLLPGQAARDCHLSGLMVGDERDEGAWPAQRAVDPCLARPRERRPEHLVVGTTGQLCDRGPIGAPVSGSGPAVTIVIDGRTNCRANSRAKGNARTRIKSLNCTYTGGWY